MDIVTRSLSKTFFRGMVNEVEAVKGVDVTVEEGDFVAITGPSGSGKSTLLSMLGLLTYPTSGEVLYGGKSVTSYSDGRRTSVRRDLVGFIFQQYNLLTHLSAWENVALPLICRGVPAAARRSAAVEMLDTLGIGGRVDFQVSNLSGGEQQRVAIARALVTDPSIVFADEPTASVDAENARLIVDLFQSLKDGGRTVIVSTHDPAVAREATRWLRMEGGRLTEAGYN